MTDSTPLFNAANFDSWKDNVGVLSSVTGLFPNWSIEYPPLHIFVLNPYNGEERKFTRDTTQRLRHPWIVYVPYHGQDVLFGTEVHIENR